MQPKYTLVCFHERLLNVPDLVVLSLDVIKCTFKKFQIDSRQKVVRACYANFIEKLTDKVLESTKTVELQVWAYAVAKAFLPDEFANLYLEDTPILLPIEM